MSYPRNECACGALKSKEANQCIECYRSEVRNSVLSIVCGCGKPKAKQATECISCYSESRPDYSHTNNCECGKEKTTEAEKCRSCYDRLRLIENKIRGPLPKSGQAAIYLLRDDNDKVFYVGSSKNPNRRLRAHRQNFGTTTRMIIIKIVGLKDRWAEEIHAAVEYENFLRLGITGANPPTDRKR